MKPFISAAFFTLLCLTWSVMAWPLTFSTAGMTYGTDCEPTPSEIASGIGESMCVASVSPLIEMSRIIAQLDAFRTCTLRPCFL